MFSRVNNIPAASEVLSSLLLLVIFPINDIIFSYKIRDTLLILYSILITILSLHIFIGAVIIQARENYHIKDEDNIPSTIDIMRWMRLNRPSFPYIYIIPSLMVATQSVYCGVILLLTTLILIIIVKKGTEDAKAILAFHADNHEDKDGDKDNEFYTSIRKITDRIYFCPDCHNYNEDPNHNVPCRIHQK